MSQPNLFSYATSELSQDAFIAWLVRWADASCADADPTMHAAGRLFVDALLGPQNFPYQSVDVKRQAAANHNGKKGAVDVTAVLRDEVRKTAHLIVIESKISAGQHGDQLVRYSGWAEALTGGDDLDGHTAIYLKIRNSSSSGSVTRNGFRVFDRETFIAALEAAVNQGASSDILTDYLDHLRRIEEQTNVYRTQKVQTWPAGRMPWEGLFSALQSVLDKASWGYVPNAQGGFMALWWGGRSFEGGNVYLQLEDGALTFRIRVDQKERRRATRNAWHRAVSDATAGSDLKIKRPDRFGHGRTMCVATIEDYRRTDPSGLLDLEQTVAGLRAAESVLEKAHRRYQALQV